MIPRPDSEVPAVTRELNVRSERRTVSSDDAFPFRIGDPVGCLFPDADGFCAMGTVRAIHPDPDGQTERDEFLVELSRTIMGVYHADQLVLRAPSIGQAALYQSIDERQFTLEDLGKLSMDQRISRTNLDDRVAVSDEK